MVLCEKKRVLEKNIIRAIASVRKNNSRNEERKSGG